MLSKRKRSEPEDTGSDWATDDFDIDSDFAESSPSKSSAAPTTILLTADQVDAVRFNTTRPGYSFEQVEIFVDQIKSTLSDLENRLYEKDVALYEAKEEQGDLQDRITTLAATIEVFRAKGDPVVKADGSYLTESQQGATSPQLEDLSRRLEEAQGANAKAASEISSLRSEVARLTSLLAQSEQQRLEAEAAEDELRTYIDETLGPWLSQQQSAQERSNISGAEEANISGENRQTDVADEGQEVASQKHDSKPNHESLPDAQNSPTRNEAPVPALGGDDWGDDAPTIGEPNHSSASADNHEEIAPAIAEAVEEPKPTPARKKAKLIDAPELQGN